MEKKPAVVCLRSELVGPQSFHTSLSLSLSRALELFLSLFSHFAPLFDHSHLAQFVLSDWTMYWHSISTKTALAVRMERTDTSMAY